MQAIESAKKHANRLRNLVQKALQLKKETVILQSKDCSADKSYCGIPASWGKTYEQTMCAYCGVDEERCFHAVCSRGITKQEDKDLILARHNEYRRKVAKGLETQVRCFLVWFYH